MLFPIGQKGSAWIMAAKLTPDQIHIVCLCVCVVCVCVCMCVYCMCVPVSVCVCVRLSVCAVSLCMHIECTWHATGYRNTRWYASLL